MKKVLIKINWYPLLSFFVIVMILNSCVFGEKPIPKIPNEITGELILEDLGEPYILEGTVKVKNGGTLEIRPGVKIIAEGKAYIAILKGGKIIADGDENNPIVFSSVLEQAGAWGGIVIFGNASAQDQIKEAFDLKDVDSGLTSDEIKYGGGNTIDDDYSGILDYVAIRYAGYTFAENKELNGLTLFGVGSQTKISNIYILDSGDDGIEFFGGTVDLKYAFVQNCEDDLFDITENWSGRGQFWIGHHCVGTFNDDGANCIEYNLDESSVSNVKIPRIYNATLVGGGSENSVDAGIEINNGGIKFKNSVFEFCNNGALNLIYPNCVLPDSNRLDISHLLIHKENSPQLFSLNSCEFPSPDLLKINEFVSQSPIVEDISSCSGARYGLNASQENELKASPLDPYFTESGSVFDIHGAVKIGNDWTSWIDNITW